MATCSNCNTGSPKDVLFQRVGLNTIATRCSEECYTGTCSRSSSNSSLVSLAAVPPLNGDGQTELHVMMCQDPRTLTVDMVQEFINDFPTAVSIGDAYGRTPLLYALKRAQSLDIVTLLFELYPQALTKSDFCGECGLYLLYHPSKPAALLQALLEVQPSLALYRGNSFSGKRLVDRICDPWSDPTVLPSQHIDAWTKLLLTVRAAHRALFTMTSIDDETCALHAALELSLSPSLLCTFVTMFPEQVRLPMKKRSNGMLPLHYVLHKAVNTINVGSVVRQMIAAFPEAARIPFFSFSTSSSPVGKPQSPPHQRLPLHLALSKGLQWTDDGVREIAYAYPDALYLHDSVTGLCTVQLAASTATGGNADTVFELLKARPVVLSSSHQ